MSGTTVLEVAHGLAAANIQRMLRKEQRSSQITVFESAQVIAQRNTFQALLCVLEIVWNG